MAIKESRKTEEVKLEPLVDLLEEQDERMQELFAKAINLFVAPGSDELDDRVKQDRLKQAIEDSLK
jgi:hypothetical protein